MKTYQPMVVSGNDWVFTNIVSLLVWWREYINKFRRRIMSKARPLSTEDRQWMENLQKEIWRKTSNRGLTHVFEKRKITSFEQEKLFTLIHEYELPCEMFSGVYDSVGIKVSDHPYIPGLEPDFIISVTAGPGSCHIEFPGEKARKLFAKFTHAGRNIELLEFYHLEKPRELASYAY